MKRLIAASILFGALSSPLAAATWYQDLDGDGCGNASVTVEADTQPLGFVLNAGDRDDADPSIGQAGQARCQLLQGNAGVNPALAGVAALVVFGALLGSGGSTNGTN